ncbi:VWA domain-containing protein [Chamaesiphon sp. OTE_75_metabat_556]|jgi:vWA found in TerF C terminus|uniref:vWA domain-containing protein n=1 Tax=Chamaesiphon sp. OTE_75_metabat_556 TaxID=2964692 RepID=UPI00286B99A7|nr:VWA domain-containing protein [Chamaesiphon sp. OTE_75_metabat_556]
MLENRDYTLIIDKSGSMSTKDKAGGLSRWQIMQESALALANKCEELDPDGITMYLFSGKFKRYDNVTAAKVSTIFQENDPSGRTDLAAVLADAIASYFQRKATGKIPANGEIILVVTDGEPDDRKAVMQVILDATQRLDRDEELAISFIQVGLDEAATKFLKILDDDLSRAGAKFDIVDTITMDDMEDITLNEILLSAIND